MFTEEARAKFKERFLRWKNGDNPYSAGKIVEAIYQNNPKEEFLGEPDHHYDFTQSEEWADTHGYYPDERGHRDDRVKKPSHHSHPNRGNWSGDNFILTEKGMLDPNYIFFGLNDGKQDPLAVLKYKGGIVLPEITITPKGTYFYNSYDNIKLNLPKFSTGTEKYTLNGGELPEIVVVGNNYIKRAQQERSRLRNIAKSYLKSTPSVSNLYNAVSAAWKALPFVTTASSVNPYINKGDAPSPGMRNPGEIAKSTKNIGQLFRADARTLKENDLDFAAQYNRLKSFLTSDGYKKRLIRYYRDKGSSIVTQNHAPESRIGEQLYNIETAHPTIKPRGKLVDSNGSFMSETTNGVYHPEEHTILVADDAIGTSVPRHEMIHARSRGLSYLNNEKYKMRTKYDRDFGPFEPAPEEGLVSYLLKRHYYGDVVELEPRVLNTLDVMQREGYDINNLSDEQIYKFLYDRPIDSHILDTQSLIDNYMPEDIPTALRNFKNIILPLGFGGVGYKYIKNTRNEPRNK